MIISSDKKLSFLMKFLIIYYIFYMVMGNLPKIVQVSFSKNDIVATEIILYVLCIIVFIIYKLKIPTSLIGICIIFIISNLWGIMYHGYFLIGSFSYVIRMILMIISSVVIGKIFYIKYGDTGIKKVIDIYMFIYIIYCIIGWIIYIKYPNSVDLWMALSQYDITINGDPHQNRFLGTYFDPNFLGNIIIFPILLSVYSFYKYSKKYIILTGIFIFTLLCTVSRSAILGLFICIVIILFIHSVLLIKRMKIRKFSLYLFAFLIIFVFLMLFLKYDIIVRITLRLLNIVNDPSSNHRFNDIKIGIQIFTQNPVITVFGIGYSYIKNDLGIDLNTLDSSLLDTIICFGIIGTILLNLFIISFFRKIKSKNFDELFFYILAYILASLIICNFNNLLYYQFYIMMLLPFLDYMYNCKEVK